MVSEGPNFIVVNNDAGTALVDAVADLVSYIQKRSPPESTAALTAAIDELKADKDQQAPFSRISEHANALSRAPPAEFESVSNLSWFVLASAPDFDAAAHVAVEKSTSPSPTVVAQQVASQAVLVSSFNISKTESPEKPFVFAKIIELASSAKTSRQFVPQLPQIAEWSQVWAAPADVKREIVSRIAQGSRTKDDASSDGVVELSKYSLELREFLVRVLTHDVAFADAAIVLLRETLVDGDSSLDRTLYKASVLPTSVLRLEAVQKSRGESGDLVEALEAIAQGDYAAFSQLSNPDIVQNVTYRRQARVAAFSRSASNTQEQELTYAQIAEVAGLESASSEAVEPLIVDAVKAGLVQGRMSQSQQRFVIESATVVGPLTDHHWDTIQSRSQAWQKSLKAVLEVSSKARNNYDLVKSLNKLEVN